MGKIANTKEFMPELIQLLEASKYVLPQELPKKKKSTKVWSKSPNRVGTNY